MPDSAFRGLILAPRGRDAALASAMLGEVGIASATCAALTDLVRELDREAGFAIVTEEALLTADTAPLKRWLDAQPEWSDFPFVLLTEGGGLERNPRARRFLDLLGNVTFVERPFHPTTLVALVRSATRARQKQYEARTRLQALAESETRYRTLFDTIEDGFTILQLVDGPGGALDDYIWIEANQTFERHSGFSNVVGRRVRDVIGDEADFWVRSIREVLLTGIPTRIERNLDFTNHYLNVSASRIEPVERGQVAVVFQDITARRKAEEQLAALNATLEQRVTEAVAERNLLADIVETTDSYVQVVDNDLKLLAINPAAAAEYARVFGRSPAVGEPLLEFIDHDAYRTRVAGIWREAMAHDQLVTVEEFGRGRNRRWYESKYNRLRDAEGNAIGAFQISDDITERIEASERLAQTEDALRQAQKMEAIGQLTGGVAHDFNNLLTIILTSSDLLRRPGLAEDRRARYIDAIAQTAERAAKLTQQLLAFSRRQALKPEVFDAGARVESTVEMLRTLVGARIALDFTAETGLLVEADAAQFETALVNLAVNARDAMEGEGALSVFVRRIDGPDATVAVTVRDTGPGIADEVKARLFEPFYTTKDVGKGTGLGLSQVYGFAKQSGGDVTVDSALGKGAAFTMTLPMTEKGIAAETAASDPVAVRRKECGRVLLVEDNDDVRDFADQILRDLGYETHAVSSAADALDALEKSDSYDLLFSDIIMQGMSGIELGREVRARYRDLPVVLTSGYSDSLATGGAGEFPLLPKPYTIDQMRRAIADACAG